MFGDDTSLSPLALIEAKIQSRISDFLRLKETLVNLSQNDSVIISERSKSLFSVQIGLESDLVTALGNIEKFKQGSWTFSDVASLTLFYYNLEKQITDVNGLQAQASGVAQSGLGWLSWLPWVLVLGIPVGLLVSKISKRNRGD